MLVDGSALHSFPSLWLRFASRGRDSLTIFQLELFSLFTNTSTQVLRWIMVNIAGGQRFLLECDVDLCILENLRFPEGG